MKTLAVMTALLLGTGCPSTIYNHPFAAPVAINTAVVVAAGTCAVECGPGDARGLSEGALIGELALSSVFAILAIETVIGLAEKTLMSRKKKLSQPIKAKTRCYEFVHSAGDGDEPGEVGLSAAFDGQRSDATHWFDLDAARELLDQLQAAIEEAEEE